MIGDAAGLADPFFGEGIATALVSGRLAADSVLAFLAGRRSDLGGYTAAVDAMLHAHLWRMRQVGRLTYRVPATTLAALDTVGPLRRLVARMAAEPFPGWAGTTQESSTAA